MSNNILCLEELKLENSSKVGEVLCTTDYDMFKYVKGNRRLSQIDLRKLIVSMRNEQLKIPIIVSHDFTIIDGQHRAAACMQLGLPVYFIVVENYGIDQVIRANTTGSKWTRKDFLSNYIGQEVKEYVRFDELRMQYKITVNDLIKIFAQIQGTPYYKATMDFEEGKFSLDGEALVEQFLMQLQTFSFFKDYTRTNFIQAFARVYARESYDHQRMVHKLEHRSHILTKQSTIDEYIAILCNNIYSYGVAKDAIYYNVESKRFHL